MKALPKLIAFVLFIVSSHAYSLGLGEAVLESSLNQPLLIRVPILNAGELSPNEIVVNIASPEDFHTQGVERTYIHSVLRTRVVQKFTHSYEVEIYTQQAFKEAWIGLLLDVRWPKGKIIKEINLLVDLAH